MSLCNWENFFFVKLPDSFPSLCLLIIHQQTCNKCDKSITLVGTKSIDSYYKEIINVTLRPGKRKNVIVQKTVACIKAELCLASTISPFIRFRTIRQILCKMYFTLFYIPHRRMWSSAHKTTPSWTKLMIISKLQGKWNFKKSK